MEERENVRDGRRWRIERMKLEEKDGRERMKHGQKGRDMENRQNEMEEKSGGRERLKIERMKQMER